MDATRLSDTVSGTALAEAPPAPLDGAAGVLFELPGVLYEATVWRRWLLRLVNRLGLGATYDVFYEEWDNQYVDEVHLGRRALNAALSEFLQAAGLSRSAVDEVVAAAAAQRKRLEDPPRLLPGVAATLKLLCQRGLLLAISADTDQATADVHGMLRALGVADRFRAVVSSRELCEIKPAPACYLAAAAALKLPPQSIVFVGLRPNHLAGAKAVGMMTVALEGRPCESSDRHLQGMPRLADLFPNRASGPSPVQPPHSSFRPVRSA